MKKITIGCLLSIFTLASLFGGVGFAKASDGYGYDCLGEYGFGYGCDKDSKKYKNYKKYYDRVKHNKKEYKKSFFKVKYLKKSKNPGAKARYAMMKKNYLLHKNDSKKARENWDENTRKMYKEYKRYKETKKYREYKEALK